MNRWREKRGSVAEATSLRFRQVRILSFKTLKTLKPKVPYRSDAFQNDHKSNGYHLKYQQQLLLCKIPPILQLMNFCQTSSVFSDPLDLLDHPLLLDIFFLGAPQLRAGVGFLFFYKVSFEKHPNGSASPKTSTWPSLAVLPPSQMVFFYFL